MKNIDRFPFLSDILDEQALLTFAALLTEVIDGYREFYGLPLLGGKSIEPPTDTISPDEHILGMSLDPPEMIAFLEDLRQQAWDLTNDDDDEEHQIGT